MKEFIEYIIKNLVDHPEEVIISQLSSPNITIFEIKAIKEDIGKIIGKNGVKIQAIRTLAHTMAAKHNLRISLHIVE